MKCPKCGGNLVAYESQFVCENCKAVFRRKTSDTAPIKNGTPPHVGSPPVNRAVAPVVAPVKNEEDEFLNVKLEEAPVQKPATNDKNDEIEALKARIAEMEKKQAAGNNRGGADIKQAFTKFAESKVGQWLKKWGLKVCLPCVLVLITAITLMVCFIGVRGVYYNVDNPNEFISFTATHYTYYGDLDGIEYVTEGTWKTKDGKIYLSYKDDFFGKQTDEYYFSKKSNKEIFIGDEKDDTSLFKRVQVTKYNPKSKKTVAITFDSNGGTACSQMNVTLGQIGGEAPKTAREGYVFQGWYDEPFGYLNRDSKRYDKEVRLWEDATYYANWWNGQEYRVSVHGNTSYELYLAEGEKLFDRLEKSSNDLYDYKYYLEGVLVDENTRMPARDVEVSCKISFKEQSLNTEFRAYVEKDGSITIYQYNGSSSNVKVPDGVARIDNGAFNNCSWLESVEIPDSVTVIALGAFMDCTGLTSVTIGKGVTCIEERAFDGCSNLTDIYYTGDVAGWCGISGLENVTAISRNGIYVSNSITLHVGGNKVEGHLSIPDGVTEIPDYAFCGCADLTSVNIPDSVTRIGNFAFSTCANLSNVTIGDGVTEIGAGAFIYCVNLKSVTIPDNVTSIDDYAFYFCLSLTNVTIGKGATEIGEFAFFECNRLVEVYDKSSLAITAGSGDNGFVGLYAKAVYTAPYTSKVSTDANGYIIYTDGKDKIFIGVDYNLLDERLTLPDGITEINHMALQYFNVTSITIPDSVTSIGEYALACSYLSEIHFEGTKAQWRAIVKGENWDSGCGSDTDSGGYIVYCTDGTIA